MAIQKYEFLVSCPELAYGAEDELPRGYMCRRLGLDVTDGYEMMPIRHQECPIARHATSDCFVPAGITQLRLDEQIAADGTATSNQRLVINYARVENRR